MKHMWEPATAEENNSLRVQITSINLYISPPPVTYPHSTVYKYQHTICLQGLLGPRFITFGILRIFGNFYIMTIVYLIQLCLDFPIKT